MLFSELRKLVTAVFLFTGKLSSAMRFHVFGFLGVVWMAVSIREKDTSCEKVLKNSSSRNLVAIAMFCCLIRQDN